MNSAITVSNLSKEYPLGARSLPYETLRDTVSRFFTGNPWRQPRTPPKPFRALHNVTFNIDRGEIVGIVGRNGAGKSTLLKILSRVTAPTQGRVVIRGRLGSLLEVGSGFHPELSGRDNIFLNGAILGMKRTEIARKFDEIVAFAEVENFIDTPVKHYSSGMYLRLAFSVAAHLETEILLVDEVLAVGDAAFQKKCLARMNTVAHEGRTVLFVSHSMSAVQALCTRGLVLSSGELVCDGSIQDAIAHYLRSLQYAAHYPLRERKDRTGKGLVTLTDIEISGHNGTSLATGAPARFAFWVSRPLPGLACVFTIYDHLGVPIASFNSSNCGPHDKTDRTSEKICFVCDIPELPLLAGRYYLNVALLSGSEVQDHVTAATYLNVEQGLLDGRPFGSNNGYGSVGIAHRWRAQA
jgi:ABC-type polysaccharide/polyol phosphate transport system, ATPase component